MDFSNIFNMFNQNQKQKPNDQTDSGIMLKNTNQSTENTNKPAFDTNEIESLLSELDAAKSNKPKASEKDYNWASHLGATLAGIGQAKMVGAGRNVSGNAAADIYSMADKERQAKDAQALADWEEKNKAIFKRISTKLALGEHLRKLDEMKASRESQSAKDARQERVDASTIALNEARANKALRGESSGSKPMTDYQREMLDLKRQEIEGKPKPLSEGEKTIEREQAKVDVKKALELPQAESNVTMIEGALAENGLLDRLEKEGDVGAGFLGYRKFLSSTEGKLGEAYRAQLSPDQQELDKVLTSLATARAKANNPTGQITNADVEMAKREIASIGDDPQVLRKVLTNSLNLEKARVEQAKALAKKTGNVDVNKPKTNQDKYGF